MSCYGMPCWYQYIFKVAVAGLMALLTKVEYVYILKFGWFQINIFSKNLPVPVNL